MTSNGWKQKTYSIWLVLKPKQLLICSSFPSKKLPSFARDCSSQKAPAKYAYQMFNWKCMEVHFMLGPLASFAMLGLLDLQFWNKSARKQKTILKRIVIAWFSQVRKTDLRGSLSGVVLIGRFDMNCIDCYNGVYRKDLENVVHLFRWLWLVLGVKVDRDWQQVAFRLMPFISKMKTTIRHNQDHWKWAPTIVLHGGTWVAPTNGRK